MPDQTDAKKILTAAPLENWRRPPGCPRTTWMKTIQQDLKSNNLSVNEAIKVTQNRPLRRLTSTFVATHAQWCMSEMMVGFGGFYLCSIVFTTVSCSLNCESLTSLSFLVASEVGACSRGGADRHVKTRTEDKRRRLRRSR